MTPQKRLCDIPKLLWWIGFKPFNFIEYINTSAKNRWTAFSVWLVFGVILGVGGIGCWISSHHLLDAFVFGGAIAVTVVFTGVIGVLVSFAGKRAIPAGVDVFLGTSIGAIVGSMASTIVALQSKSAWSPLVVDLYYGTLIPAYLYLPPVGLDHGAFTFLGALSGVVIWTLLIGAGKIRIKSDGFRRRSRSRRSSSTRRIIRIIRLTKSVILDLAAVLAGSTALLAVGLSVFIFAASDETFKAFAANGGLDKLASGACLGLGVSVGVVFVVFKSLAFVRPFVLASLPIACVIVVWGTTAQAIIFDFALLSATLMVFHPYIAARVKTEENSEGAVEEVLRIVLRRCAASLIVALMAFVLAQFIEPLSQKLTIVAIGFSGVAFLTPRLPAYLSEVPLFFYQLWCARSFQPNTGQTFTEVYWRKCILFVDQMILLPMPKLPEFPLLVARYDGIDSAVREVNYIYERTFQRRAFAKTLNKFATDDELSFAYLYRLRQKSHWDLLEACTTKSEIAQAYVMLGTSEITPEKLIHATSVENTLLIFKAYHAHRHAPEVIEFYELFLSLLRLQQFSEIPSILDRIEKIEGRDTTPVLHSEYAPGLCALKEKLQQLEDAEYRENVWSQRECLLAVCRQLTPEPFNNWARPEKEIAVSIVMHLIYLISREIKNLPVGQSFVSLTNLRRLADIGPIMQKMRLYEDFVPALGDAGKILRQLNEIEVVERAETKREYLLTARRQLDSQQFRDKFFGSWMTPEREMAVSMVTHIVHLIERKLVTLQTQAVLSVSLINSRLFGAAEGLDIKLKLSNTGQSIIQDIHVELALPTEETYICLDGNARRLGDLEPERDCQAEFHVQALYAGNTHLAGQVTYADAGGEVQQQPFDFPLEIDPVEKRQFLKIVNPYIPGNPIISSELFYGQQVVLDFLCENLVSRTQKNTIVLHGQRRMGKTSILLAAERDGLGDERFIPIYLDAQSITSDSDLYEQMSGAITTQLKRRNFPAPPVGDFRTATHKGFSDFCQRLSEAIPDHRVVLMIDEFEEIGRRVKEGEINKFIFSSLRNLMQFCEPIIFVFCGGHQFDEDTYDYWDVFFNSALYHRISFLDAEDADRLIKIPVKGDLDYDPLAVERITTLTRGHPYFIQLVCYLYFLTFCD